jgi:hypothetical protein
MFHLFIIPSDISDNIKSLLIKFGFTQSENWDHEWESATDMNFRDLYSDFSTAISQARGSLVLSYTIREDFPETTWGHPRRLSHRLRRLREVFGPELTLDMIANVFERYLLTQKNHAK